MVEWKERGHPSPEDAEGDGGLLLVRPQAGEQTLQLWQRASLSGPPAAPRAVTVSCGRRVPSPQPQRLPDSGVATGKAVLGSGHCSSCCGSPPTAGLLAALQLGQIRFKSQVALCF